MYKRPMYHYLATYEVKLQRLNEDVGGTTEVMWRFLSEKNKALKKAEDHKRAIRRKPGNEALQVRVISCGLIGLQRTIEVPLK